jgi:hypothetical protein
VKRKIKKLLYIKYDYIKYNSKYIILFYYSQKKVINIFDENTKFISYKELTDKDPFGWKILRLMTLEQRNEIIKNKSHYLAKSIYDWCLYSNEKVSIMFEILNTK